MITSTHTPTPEVLWAVTSEKDWLQRNIPHRSRLFEELKDALEYAKAFIGCAYVWLANERGGLVAMGREGKLFYSFEPSLSAESTTKEIVPASNPLRAAFPWTIDPSEDFCIEPGLSKREWLAGSVMAAMMGSDLEFDAATDPIEEIAQHSVLAADALLRVLAEPHREPSKPAKRRGYLSPTEGWVTDQWPD